MERGKEWDEYLPSIGRVGATLVEPVCRALVFERRRRGKMGVQSSVPGSGHARLLLACRSNQEGDQAGPPWSFGYARLY